MRAPRRRTRGFTLVEMIVATVVLAIGVVSAMLCIGSATRVTGIAQEYTRATLIAQRRLAEIDADPNQLSGGEQQGDYAEEEPGFRWAQSVEPTGISGLVRVSLAVEWKSPTGTRRALFSTYRRVQTSQ